VLRVSCYAGFSNLPCSSRALFRVQCASEIQLKDTDWQYEDELELLRDDIKLIADQCRADETKKMVNAIEVRRAPFSSISRY
jgi:NACalpha-BTF3-like transcription factor